MTQYSPFKMIMFSIMLMSTMMSISSTNMFMMWLCLELNLFSFIPLLTDKNKTEASIDYFLPQALGSTLLLMSSTMILSSHWLQKLNFFLLFIATSLKLGIAPYHHWFPLTMEKTNWLNCLILSTWQKIAPLFIILFILSLKMKTLLTNSTLIINVMVGSIMGLSQTSMKKIMAYSSISHMGWMLSALTMHMKCLSLTYFCMYILISTPLLLILNKMNATTINNTWNKQNMPQLNKIMTMLLLLSLAGIPPLTGFIPKLLIMASLMSHSMMIMSILIISSMTNLFFYLNISLNIIMNQKNYTINNNTTKTTYFMLMSATWGLPSMILLLYALIILLKS